MPKKIIISPEIEPVAKKIEAYKEEHGNAIPKPSELIELFSSRDQLLLLSADEAAYVFTAIAGRDISTDYVKRLRLDKRLVYAKQVSARAFIYRLRDVLMVEFKRPYANKPTGRPKKSNLSDTA